MHRTLALTFVLLACGDNAAPPVVDPPEDPTDNPPEDPVDPPDDPVDPPPNAAPTVRIVFPPPASTTDGDKIVVRGTASDGDGIAEIRVNGELATSTDGFATWTSEVSLAEGVNALVVSAADALGASDEDAARANVLRRELVGVGEGVAVDETNVYALDRRRGSLIITDRATGRRSERGLPLATPVARFAMAVDRSRDQVFVATNGGVVAFHPIAGIDEISTATTAPAAIAADEANGKIYVADLSDRLLAIDVENGASTVVSADTRGDGPALKFPAGVAVDGDRVLVLAGIPRTLIAVDPATGDRTVIGPLVGSQGGQIALDGDRVLVADGDQLLAVSLATGATQSLGAVSTRSVAVDAGKAFVPELTGLAELDLATFARRELVDPDLGTGTPLIDPGAVVATENGAVLIDETGGPSRLIAVDLETRDRAIVEGLSSAHAVTEVAPGKVLVLESFALRLLDLETGASRVISSDLDLFQGTSLAYDRKRDRAFVQTTFDTRVLSYDLATGAQEMLIDLDNDGFATRRRLAVDSEHDRLLITDAQHGVVFAVDLETEQLSSIGGTVGEALQAPLAIAVDRTRNIALVGDESTLFAIDLEAPHLVSFVEAFRGPSLAGMRGIALTSEDRAWITTDNGLQLLDRQTGHHVLVGGR